MIDREKVVKRLCMLSGGILNTVYGYHIPGDCFCGENQKTWTWEDGYRYDEKVIEFIEDAVREKIAAEFDHPEQENNNAE
jgi:hypothetical protein